MSSPRGLTRSRAVATRHHRALIPRRAGVTQRLPLHLVRILRPRVPTRRRRAPTPRPAAAILLRAIAPEAATAAGDRVAVAEARTAAAVEADRIAVAGVARMAVHTAAVNIPEQTRIEPRARSKTWRGPSLLSKTR